MTSSAIKTSPPCTLSLRGSANQRSRNGGGTLLASIITSSLSRRLCSGGRNMGFGPPVHAYLHPPLGQRKSSYHRSMASVSLKSLFIDHHMHHAAADITQSFSLPSANTHHLVGWNRLKGDIGEWLVESPPPNDNNVNINTPRMKSFSSSIIIASPSTPEPRHSPDRPPTKSEIELLQTAFASFYGAEKNTHKAYELLTKCIDIWETTHQSGDEIAGLYRVRGDMQMVSELDKLDRQWHTH